MTAKPDALIAALDVAAIKMVEMATAPEKDADGKPVPVALSDRVRAFDAAAKWAERRLGVVPAEKTESKFDVLKRDFHDEPHPVERRGIARKGAKKGGADSEPPAGANPINGAESFLA